MTTKKTTTTTESTTGPIVTSTLSETDLKLIKANAIVDALVRHGFAVHGGIPQTLYIDPVAYEQLGGGVVELTLDTPYFPVKLEPRAS